MIACASFTIIFQFILSVCFIQAPQRQMNLHSIKHFIYFCLICPQENGFYFIFYICSFFPMFIYRYIFFCLFFPMFSKEWQRNQCFLFYLFFWISLEVLRKIPPEPRGSYRQESHVYSQGFGAVGKGPNFVKSNTCLYKILKSAFYQYKISFISMWMPLADHINI